MISEGDVRHVAKLARLRLEPEEVRLFQGQLGRVLDHMEELGALDLSSVEPAAHVPERAHALRPDRPERPACVQEILANAPAREGSFFKVPRVLG
jgi:aspartyl-tRNA(Asn)/glutamyl-tRNA(Gln) amidotransferase subunit C